MAITSSVSRVAPAELFSRRPTDDERARAREILGSSTVIDTCGAIRPTGPGGSLDDSIAELRANGINGVGLTLAAEEDGLQAAMNMILKWNGLIRSYSNDLVHVRSADEIRQAREDGRIAVYYLLQNGRPFEDDPGNVELFRQMGVTSSQITYNKKNFLGDGCLEPRDGGLSLLGREVIAEMNRVGMLVDLSHASRLTQQDAVLASTRPVYFSHCNVNAICSIPRNAADDTLELVADRGGMAGVYPLDLTHDGEATVANVGEHLEHLLRVMGPDRVSFASDFPKGRPIIYELAHLDDDGYLHIQHDGTHKVRRMKWDKPGCVPFYPWYKYAEGVGSYGEFVNVACELLVRGVPDDVVAGVLGENFLTFYEANVG
ncbi:membrane dipeptidase [Microbacterium sp. ASV81]|uniref:Membrane dipeptidase n=1 Tax=Microbacterium capsulatum TaxID=3041921 RepID=A0ABU0XEN3_9MICO|nr:membrane dipeptidase [Microbacterium sp. ASV81]MDQ4213078.1 membrane dipeptidase [Microbacterium sp. ASV81]